MSDTTGLRDIATVLRQEYHEQHGEDLPPLPPEKEPKRGGPRALALLPYLPIVAVVAAALAYPLLSDHLGAGQLKADLDTTNKSLAELKQENAFLANKLSETRWEFLRKVEGVGPSVEKIQLVADKVINLERSQAKAQDKVTALTKALSETAKAQEATAAALKTAQEELQQTSKALAAAQTELAILKKTRVTATTSIIEGQMEFPLGEDAREVAISFPKYGNLTKKFPPAVKLMRWQQGGKEVNPRMLKGRYDVLLTLRGDEVVRADIALSPIQRKE